MKARTSEKMFLAKTWIQNASHELYMKMFWDRKIKLKLGFRKRRVSLGWAGREGWMPDTGRLDLKNRRADPMALMMLWCFSWLWSASHLIPIATKKTFKGKTVFSLFSPEKQKNPKKRKRYKNLPFLPLYSLMSPLISKKKWCLPLLRASS